MPFDPKATRFPYPEITDAHYLVVKKDDGTVFDADYPYVDTSKSFRWKQWWVRLLLRLIVFPFARIYIGLKIVGRENLKKHREELSKGFVTVSNHVHVWDYISIMKALRPIRPHVLVWAKNVRGESGSLIRLNGGVPIPEDDAGASLAFVKSMRKLLKEGGTLHVYAEGSMWEYYMPIRPFKRGASYFACSTDRPVLPLAFSYRKPGFFRRLFHKEAAITLTIGEPLYPDEALPKKEREADLTRRLHDEVCRLAGIDPKGNIYPALFDNDKRVDYYTTEYGKK